MNTERYAMEQSPFKLNQSFSLPFPGVDWVLLDTCYLRADRDVSGWREIFSSLGVRDLLIFKKEKRTFTASELVRWRPHTDLC